MSDIAAPDETRNSISLKSHRRKTNVDLLCTHVISAIEDVGLATTTDERSMCVRHGSVEQIEIQWGHTTSSDSSEVEFQDSAT